MVVVLTGVPAKAAPTSKQRGHAKKLAEAGSTLILGSHSHWAGAMELIDGRPVLYSLGNLVFDLTRSEETVEGLVVEITFWGTTDPDPPAPDDHGRPRSAQPARGGG